MRADEQELRAVPDPAARVLACQELISEAEHNQRVAGVVLRDGVRELRDAGWSHQQVADHLGLSRPRAQQLAKPRDPTESGAAAS